ncbi:MAG: TonB-dependent receptor [Anaerolineaceae bacterium]|nr:TonB-dependent receptor [Anaerolineaceae bacterium]
MCKARLSVSISAAVAAMVPMFGLQPVHAQEASRMLEEVVVTAQRREQSLQDVPISVLSLSSDFLENSGVTNIQDIASAVPGLTYTVEGAFAQPTVRGVSGNLTQAGADSPVAIYLDGLYQPNQMGNFFDLPDVESIEVLKGPQGTLFGRNATGGAIMVKSKRPSFVPEGVLSLSNGVFTGSDKNANEVVGKAYVSGGLIDNVLAGSVSAIVKHNEGFMVNDLNGSRAGKDEGYLVKGRLLYEPTDSSTFLLTAYKGKTEDYRGSAMVPIDGRTVAAQYPDAVIPTKPWHVASELHKGSTYVETESEGVSLEAVFEFESGTLTSLTGYTKIDGFINHDVDGAYSPSCQAVVACITPYYVGYGPSKTFQQEFSFASEKIGDFSYVAGVLLYKDEHDIDTRVNPALTATGKDTGEPGVFFTSAVVETEAYAAFGELTWDVNDRLSMIFGLRYSWEEKVGKGSVMGGSEFNFSGKPDWDAWTPRLSVLYAVNDSVNVYATYSEGFKSGVVDSVSLTSDVADPEEIKSYEVGVKVDTGLYRLNIAAYYYDYTDVQVQFFEGVGTVVGNAADAEVYGLDVDGLIKLTPSLELRGGISWLPTADYKTFDSALGFAPPFGPYGMQQLVLDAGGERMRRSPKLSGNVALSYNTDIDAGAILANLMLNYSDEFAWELTRNFKNDSHTTVGANISFQPHDSGFKYTVWGKNLTNEKYLTGTTVSVQGYTGNWTDPRQIGATVEYSF